MKRFSIRYRSVSTYKALLPQPSWRNFFFYQERTTNNTLTEEIVNLTFFELSLMNGTVIYGEVEASGLL